jgi:CHASE1-domain containing sensor protein
LICWETDHRTGFVIRVPVFHQASGRPGTHAPEFLGSVAVTLRVWDVFQSLLGEGRLQGLNVRLSDQGSRHVPLTPIKGVRMFELTATGDTFASRYQRELDVYGRQWQLDFSPASIF